MNKISKRKKWALLFVGAVSLVFACWCFKPASPKSPESRFKEFFSDLSIGAPAYQILIEFDHPQFVIKDDFCSADFKESEPQFAAFAVQLGIPPESLLSPKGAFVKAGSKINPNYSWLLQVSAVCTNAATRAYLVHIEGHQPYN